MVGVRDHLGEVAAAAEVDQRVAGDLGGEARAPPALDTALAVEQHEVADRGRLLEVTLLLHVARLARPERQRLVLERALAAAVAHRAVERMVDQQELEDTVLRLAHVVLLGVHDHAVVHRGRARDLEPAQAFDLDEAHATHADRLHAVVPAEARDVGAVLLGRLDEQLAVRDLDLAAVDGDAHLLGTGTDGQHVLPLRRPLAHRLVRHRPPPPGAATGMRVLVSAPMRSAISSRK